MSWYNIIRYNVCSNNGQNSSISYMGELYLGNGGGKPFNGIQIYNNTFYWNPAGPGPVIAGDWASYSGPNPTFFRNNIIYSIAPDMVHATSGLTLDNNIYWTTSGDAPTWQIDGNIYTGFAAYQAGTGQDSHSFYADPMMINPTYHEAGRPTTAFTLMPGSPAMGTVPTFVPASLAARWAIRTSGGMPCRLGAATALEPTSHNEIAIGFRCVHTHFSRDSCLPCHVEPRLPVTCK